MSNKQLITLLGIASLTIILFMLAAIFGWQWYYNNQTTTSAEVITTESPTITPTVVDTPQPLPTPTSATAKTTTPINSLADNLIMADLPIRDQRGLAMRLKHHEVDIPLVVHDTSTLYQLNDSEELWVTDNYQTPPHQFQVEATLSYITDHSYWWVEEGFKVSPADLEASAKRFEEQTYPTNRAFFGSEWSPGIDGDERVHVFMGNVPGVAGYFAAANSYSKLAEEYSNEREMFFLNLNAIRPGSGAFDGVLAHEFQHMIHWNQDRNEDTWVNEGASELASFINGLGQSNFTTMYLARPETQLNTWAVDQSKTPPHYGGAFLFLSYFLEQYGEEMMQAVVAHPLNGLAGFDVVLSEHGYTERFNDIFADFLTANYLRQAEGRWGYQSLELSQGPHTDIVSSALEEDALINQYGARYIELDFYQPITLSFEGQTTTRVIDNNAHSGQYQWYSHRGDDTNTRLTRAVDLSSVESATLNFWTWYDIEPNWDYAYVSISTDGGEHWTLLQSERMATDNPSGNAYGPGYTGNSEGWVEETIDISAFAGQSILMRFDYVTDDAVNHPGWTLDDVGIPEIGFFDDMEQDGENGWLAEGFVRTDNLLPQQFLVQLLEIGAETTIRRMELTGDNVGQLKVDGLGSTVDEAVLIISGLTPVTTEPASYHLTISE